jgi:hypothetical protein
MISRQRPPEDGGGKRKFVKPLDSEGKKVYAPRFIIESFTRRGCNGLPLNPVLVRVVEGRKKLKKALLLQRNAYIYSNPI